MSEVDFEDLSRAVEELNQDQVEKLTRKLVESNVDPSEIIEKGLADGIKRVGSRYEKGEYFISELMYGANVFSVGYHILEPLLKERAGGRKKGIVVLGTVAGDIHSIGKDIVKTMLIAAGFTVHDLGVDVSVDDFIKAVRDFAPDVVGASALLSTTIPVQQEILERLKKEGLRNRVKVVVGGAATTENWAMKIGADGWGQTAVEAVKKIVELTSGSGKNE